MIHTQYAQSQIERLRQEAESTIKHAAAIPANERQALAYSAQAVSLEVLVTHFAAKADQAEQELKSAKSGAGYRVEEGLRYVTLDGFIVCGMESFCYPNSDRHMGWSLLRVWIGGRDVWRASWIDVDGLEERAIAAIAAEDAEDAREAA